MGNYKSRPTQTCTGNVLHLEWCGVSVWVAESKHVMVSSGKPCEEGDLLWGNSHGLVAMLTELEGRCSKDGVMLFTFTV